MYTHTQLMYFSLTSTVSEAVQDVTLVAQALKAAWVVDAGVVAGSLEGALVDVWGETKEMQYITSEKHGS